MYTIDGRIRYSEVGRSGKLTLAGLVNYFQDCSTFHSEDIGRGPEYLAERNRAWILSAWQIVIESMPELNEHIQVATWPYAFKGFMGLRNYEMTDKSGVQLAVANAMWTMLDIEKRCPVRITDDDTIGYELEGRADMEYAPRKIRIEGCGSEQPPVYIAKERIDTNGHMNNGQYVGLASEYLPEGVCVRQIRVEYKKEVYPGAMLTPYIYNQTCGLTVSLCQDGCECAIVDFSWNSI